MKNALPGLAAILLLACVPVTAESCLILKRMGPADEVTSRLYAFGLKGKQFQYVQGEFPQGLKFHGRLTDADVRNIQQHGGRIVVVEPKYTAADLQQARESCMAEEKIDANPAPSEASRK